LRRPRYWSEAFILAASNRASMPPIRSRYCAPKYAAWLRWASTTMWMNARPISPAWNQKR